MNTDITKIPFWKNLNQEDKEMVKSSAVVKHYEAGQLIHGRCDGGNSCLGFVYVLTGDIRTYVVSPEGREITIFKMKAGDYCVLAASCVLSRIKQETQMVALTDTDLMVIPAPVLAKLVAKNAEIKAMSYELAAEKLSNVMSVFEEILFVPLETRLASYLVEQCEATGSGELKTTQEKVAQEINSVREVVARELNRFAKSGIVSLKRGTIIINDIEELEEML